MSIPAVNQLANMEFLLYGGRSGANMNCPSFVNNYMGASRFNAYGMNPMMNYYNPAFRGGYSGQDVFTHANDATSVNNPLKDVSQNNSQVDWSNPQFRGLSDDLNEIGDYYIKNSAPSESFVGAAVGGAAFGLINNPRMIVHPWNSIASTKAVSEMFKGIKDETSTLGKLWRGMPVKVNGEEFKGGYELLSNAYSRMHKLESLHNWKFGLFRKSIVGAKTADGKDLYTHLKGVMESALKSGDPKKIAEATEELKRATNAFTGLIPRGLRKIGLQDQLTWLRKKINPTHYEPLAEVAKNSITEAGKKTTFKQFMKHSCGIKNGIFFAGMEFLNDYVFEKKIQKAFDKDTKTGITQLGQTLVKGVGSAAGWAIGEGVGAWAGAKLGAIAGAKLGTVISPGVGTAIGAVAGLIGGSIGCWLFGKAAHAITGTDVGTLAEVEKMKSTKDGQVQLLSLTAQQAEGDKKLDPRTMKALQNVANFYGAGNK